ncbi:MULTISPECIES: hypothetical protein [unclassified Streptomyces]|uniref:hypothetical protein n=1 Tax=unclassified Streptomyces TaxID=2593676 RepID=UPI001F2D4AAC|nr:MULTISPECIES: hypothetical protein [unclassified Streptomyces]MCF0086612.1 hypothetical protein [Streptomyces sp. MH192]MCF0098766.1 hypothetical protein [Streptomyces sp. MH191]
MGHRPYPNVERTRRYVDSRHGSACPRCGHAASVHPYKHGQFVCSRSREGMPSCRECAARIMRLRSGPLSALADAAVGFQMLLPPLPSVNIAPGRARIGNQITVAVKDDTMSVADAVRRGLISVDSSRRGA